MDFIAASCVNLSDHVDKLAGLRTSLCDERVFSHEQGALQYLVFGSEASTSAERTSLCIFDGQASLDGIFYHSHFLPKSVSPLVRAAHRQSKAISNGVFCAGLIENREDDPSITLATDWASQYPIYIWKDGSRAIISNNVAMISAICGGGRNVTQGAHNLVSIGGGWETTHVDAVMRLDVGSYVVLNGRSGLKVVPRSDHGPLKMSYVDAIELAQREISAHISAVIASTAGARYICDLTGGRDTRAVLALLDQWRDLEYTVRCMGVFPSPDANVAGFLMDKLGLQGCQYPSVNLPAEVAIRQNAVLSGGGRESGNCVSPVAFRNLVHFKGTFGELGGGNAGIDYIGDCMQLGEFSFDKALDLLFQRQERVGMFRFVTQEAVAYGRAAETLVFRELERRGIQRQDLFAERYIRVKCRSHFGLASYISNKNHISPDPLANRWLVEARRKLPVALYRKNKAIFDLISLSSAKHFEFMPMANGKWDETIVPSRAINEWREMKVVQFGSPNLSGRTGSLFNRVAVRCPPESSLRTLGISVSDKPEQAVVPQLGQWEINKAVVRFFLTNISSSDDVWRWFSRDNLIQMSAECAQPARADGLDSNAMGIVAASLAWKFGVEATPVTRQIASVSQ